MTYKLVRVLWSDACAISAWTKIGDAVTPDPCTTEGRLVEETPDHIIVASTISGDEYNAAMKLKRSWIDSITEIKEAPP